jgi:hypothetical protein
MTSEVEICNRALSKIGTRSTIASLTEDSQEAHQCNILYTPTRDETLGMAFWNFGRKTTNLGLVKSAPGTPTNPSPAGWNGTWSDDFPAPPWLYEYTYPSDCIQMRYIGGQLTSAFVGDVPIFGSAVTAAPQWTNVPVMFIISTDLVSGNQASVILTNQYQAIGTYTMRITNPDLFGAQFTEALVAALAGKLAIPLTGDKGLAAGLFQQANSYIISARASDGNEGLTIQDSPVSWIQARELGGYTLDGYYVAPYNPLFIGGF